MQTTHHFVTVAIVSVLCLAVAVAAFHFNSSATFLIFMGFESVLSLVIYRLTLHPLAQYPGPWYAAVAEAYNIYSCLNGERHLQFKICRHDRYGPVVRYAPNRLSFCEEKAVQEIYGVRANTQKSQVYGGFNFLFKASASLTCIDREQHAFKRKVLSQALTQVNMKSFEPPMLENVRILMSDVLEDDPSDWSKPYDLSVTFQRLFADIMADTIFSSRWDMQTSEAKRWILDILPLGTSGLHAAGHMILALKLRIEQLLLPKTMRDVRRFLALSREQCETRLNKQASGASCQDLFSSVLRASDLEDMGGKGSSQTFTMNDLVAESGLLIVAGGDTTATAITATLFYLLRYPKIFRQVRDEIDSAFARHHTDNVEVVTIGPALSNCKLLEACVEEALRLSPPVSGLLPRQVLQGGLLVAGRWQVPAGTDVGIPSYAIHHSEVYWRHPNRFKPERWLQKESQDDRSVFMPFGVGRTSCVGKQLAYNEMALVIARILWTYDLKMIEGSQRYGENGISGGNGEWGRRNPDEFQTRDVFTSSHNGPLVRFRKR